MEGLLKSLFKMLPNGAVQKAVISLLQKEFEQIDEVDDLRDLTVGQLLDKWGKRPHELLRTIFAEIFAHWDAFRAEVQAWHWGGDSSR